MELIVTIDHGPLARFFIILLETPKKNSTLEHHIFSNIKPIEGENFSKLIDLLVIRRRAVLKKLVS